MGEAGKDALQVNFDRKLRLAFHGVKVTSDAERLCVDPAMRQVVEERAKDKKAGSVSQMEWDDLRPRFSATRLDRSVKIAFKLALIVQQILNLPCLFSLRRTNNRLKWRFAQDP